MREIAAAVAEPIGRLGGAFMISREAKAFAAETGLSGWTPYFRGRFGVLGEVDADVVMSAAGFFPATTVRRAWEAGAGLPAAEAADRYAAVAHGFGRRKLAGFAAADRLADLLQRVADEGGAADVVGAPVFAGWRAMPLPADGPARVVQLAHVVRELRGGLHVVAVLASGLSPLEAVLSGRSPLLPSGEPNAEYFGWPRPYPEVTAETRRRHDDAEQLTDELMGPAFASLDKAEAEELTALLGQAENTVFGT
ncbi:SCO6745 family protein [Actinomadura chibensis]|uniref:EvbL n=1 Tax=Actinomadura chibensis TaxID=392828 RepID=A0A5D0NLH5_9ACTN|nr:hypothetical protein [Actinomadura chibensis]TYB45317.1 hypothetical protein FXF69_17855 [Actinomadura chibensis]